MQYDSQTRGAAPARRETSSWEAVLLTEVGNTRFGVFLVNIQNGEVTYIEKVIRRRIDMLKGANEVSARRKARK